MFGDWLKNKRLNYQETNKKTYMDFSNEVGYSIAHLRGIETNDKNPPLEYGLQSIAKVLNLSASEYEEMFSLAFVSRIVIERRKIKKILGKEIGFITSKEFNTAVHAFEANLGIMVKLYSGELQETMRRKLINYINKIRLGEVVYNPNSDNKNVG